MEVQLKTSHSVFVKEIATIIRNVKPVSFGKWNMMLRRFESIFVLIVYLSSFLALAVNNAKETSRFWDASVFL